MKKLFAFITCFVMVAPLFAQKRSSFSIFTGYGAYTIHGKYPGGGKFTLRPEESIVIATDYEFPISGNFYLQPGLMYIQKGANFDSYLYMGQDYYGDVKLSYVVVPATIVFKPSLGKGKMIIGAGPFLGLGLGREAGVVQGHYNIRFKKNVSSAEIAENPFYYSPWDTGGNFILGYQLKSNFFIQLNGQVGMKRINPSVDHEWEGNAKHKNAGVVLLGGFRF
ncbi:MAG TPA: outer membrane beta-barrel protein [Flavisolibacter sp.]